MITELLFFFSILLLFVVFQTKNVLINKVIFFCLILSLIILAGFRDSTVDRDYHVYLFYWQLRQVDVEISFVILKNFLKNYLNLPFATLLITYAILGVTTKLIGIKRISPFFYLSCLVYFSHYYLLHELTQIRAGVATGFFLIALYYLYERKAEYFIFFVICAGFFHYSAFIALPLWFIRKDSKNIYIYTLLIPIGYILHFIGGNVFSHIPIPYIQEKAEVYQKLQDLSIGDADKINVFNYMFLSKIAILLVLLFNAKKIYLQNQYIYLLLKIYAISLAAFPGLSAVPASAFRVQEFLGVVEIILIPMIVYLFRVRFIGYLVVVLIAVGYLMLNLFYNKLIL